MREGIARKGADPRFPLIQDKVQAEIMAHIRAEARPVSRARLNDALDSSRGKISAEVGQLLEAGLLAEEGFADSEGGADLRYSSSLVLRALSSQSTSARPLSTLPLRRSAASWSPTGVNLRTCGTVHCRSSIE